MPKKVATAPYTRQGEVDALVDGLVDALERRTTELVEAARAAARAQVFWEMRVFTEAHPQRKRRRRRRKVTVVVPVSAKAKKKTARRARELGKAGGPVVLRAKKDTRATADKEARHRAWDAQIAAREEAARTDFAPVASAVIAATGNRDPSGKFCVRPVVVSTNGGKAEFVALLIGEPKPGFLSVRRADHRHRGRYTERVDRVVSGEVLRDATADEARAGRTLRAAAEPSQDGGGGEAAPAQGLPGDLPGS